MQPLWTAGSKANPPGDVASEADKKEALQDLSRDALDGLKISRVWFQHVDALFPRFSPQPFVCLRNPSQPSRDRELADELADDLEEVVGASVWPARPFSVRVRRLGRDAQALHLHARCVLDYHVFHHTCFHLLVERVPAEGALETPSYEYVG